MSARALALVTGGCRRLGAAICVALADAGHDLAIHSSPDSAPEDGLGARFVAAGGAWHHVTADLADAQAVAALLPAVAAAAGRMPTLLVNNAARFGEDTPETVTQTALIDHYAVNAVAPMLLAQALAATAGADAPRTIVNILDQRIAAPHADQFAYTLSKLALAEATTILARRFAPHVRVCGVAPGLTLPTADYDEALMAKAARLMPLDRLAEPTEIADAVVFLAKARAITGQVIFVDGGAHLCRYARDFLYLAGGQGSA